MHMHDEDIKYIVMTDVLIRRIGYLRMEGIWGEAAPNELIPITLVSLWEVLPGLWKGPAKTNQLFHSGRYWAKTPLILLSNLQRRCPLKKNGVFTLAGICSAMLFWTKYENRWPLVATRCQCIQGSFHPEFSANFNKKKNDNKRCNASYFTNCVFFVYMNNEKSGYTLEVCPHSALNRTLQIIL